MSEDLDYIMNHFGCDECHSDFHMDDVIVRKFDNPFIPGDEITVLLCNDCANGGE
jgi:hypothetical protein